MRQPDVSSDDRSFAYRYPAQYLCIRINRYVVFNNRMAGYIHRQAVFVKGKALCAQCHALIKLNMVSNDSRLPYDNTRSVVYAEELSDAGAGMEVDSGIRMGHFRNDAR